MRTVSCLCWSAHALGLESCQSQMVHLWRLFFSPPFLTLLLCLRWHDPNIWIPPDLSQVYFCPLYQIFISVFWATIPATAASPDSSVQLLHHTRAGTTCCPASSSICSICCFILPPPPSQEAILDIKRIRVSYLRTWFIPDVIAAFPIGYILLFAVIMNSTAAAADSHVVHSLWLKSCGYCRQPRPRKDSKVAVKLLFIKEGLILFILVFQDLHYHNDDNPSKTNKMMRILMFVRILSLIRLARVSRLVRFFNEVEKVCQSFDLSFFSL